jgi:hypothetical protein
MFMIRKLSVAALVLGLVAATTHSLRADVKTDEKSLVKFEGMLGRVVGIFGGKAAREGVKSSVAVRGDRMATFSDTTGNIVDLKEEKIYDLDMKKKNYKVITFAELRKQIEDAQKKAAEEMKKAQAEAKTAPQQQAPPPNDGKQMEVDFDLKASGQTKTINGFDAKEFIMTVTMREKGKKLEESGGMVLTSNIWEAPRIAAMKEIADFQIRFAKAIATPMIQGASQEEMASAMAMYPMMKDAIARARTEAVKMDGTPILTTTTIEAVQSAEQIAQSQQQQQQGSTSSSTPTNPTAAVGSLLGGLMKRGQKPSNAAPVAPGHATIMTTTTEVLKVGTTVVDADLSIPAGFKENK